MVNLFTNLKRAVFSLFDRLLAVAFSVTLFLLCVKNLRSVWKCTFWMSQNAGVDAEEYGRYWVGRVVILRQTSLSSILEQLVISGDRRNGEISVEIMRNSLPNFLWELRTTVYVPHLWRFLEAPTIGASNQSCCDTRDDVLPATHSLQLQLSDLPDRTLCSCWRLNFCKSRVLRCWLGSFAVPVGKSIFSQSQYSL